MGQKRGYGVVLTGGGVQRCAEPAAGCRAVQSRRRGAALCRADGGVQSCSD